MLSETETRLWALIEDREEGLPLLTLGEARVVVELLQILSSGDGEGSDVAYRHLDVCSRESWNRFAEGVRSA